MLNFNFFLHLTCLALSQANSCDSLFLLISPQSPWQSHTGWLKCYITLFFCWITVIS